jgi:hypothetical protein
MLQQPPSGPSPPHNRGFTITLRHTTLGRTPLDEGSARRKDLYLTKHNTHNRQISMPSAGFEPTLSVNGQPRTYALDHAAREISSYKSGAGEIYSCVLGVISHPLQGANPYNVGVGCLKWGHSFTAILHLVCMGLFLVKFEILYQNTVLYISFYILIFRPDNG